MSPATSPAAPRRATPLSTEYNFRINDMVTWTRGRHTLKFGAGIPHIGRRAFDDNTNALGTYTFGPTLNADGIASPQPRSRITRTTSPPAFSQNTGDVHFIYHQQEMGAFIQDQFKINARFSITPGIRYDWQNFLATKRLGFSPRVSFAWVLDEDSKTGRPRRRRHLLRSLRLRSPARPGPL